MCSFFFKRSAPKPVSLYDFKFESELQFVKIYREVICYARKVFANLRRCIKPQDIKITKLEGGQYRINFEEGEPLKAAEKNNFLELTNVLETLSNQIKGNVFSPIKADFFELVKNRNTSPAVVSYLFNALCYLLKANGSMKKALKLADKDYKNDPHKLDLLWAFNTLYYLRLEKRPTEYNNAFKLGCKKSIKLEASAALNRYIADRNADLNKHIKALGNGDLGAIKKCVDEAHLQLSSREWHALKNPNPLESSILGNGARS